eukprot:11745601-Karenia_brevis.AAC.1
MRKVVEKRLRKQYQLLDMAQTAEETSRIDEAIARLIERRDLIDEQLSEMARERGVGKGSQQMRRMPGLSSG